MLCQSIDRAIKRHRYRTIAFVLMPEHVHLLVFPEPHAAGVDELLKAIKRPFSFRIKQLPIQSNARHFLLSELVVDPALPAIHKLPAEFLNGCRNE